MLYNLGKWLHACLHLAGRAFCKYFYGFSRIAKISFIYFILRPAAEGDLEKNAKLWYEQVDSHLLTIYWGKDQPIAKATDSLRKIQKLLYDPGHSHADQSSEHGMELRQVRWKEIVCILEALETRLGWEEVDGTVAYTKEESSSHKSMVLG